MAPFVEGVLSLEDLAKLLWEHPQASHNLVLCGASPDTETAKAHVAFANVPAVPEPVRKRYKLQPIGRLPFREGHAYVTDLFRDGDIWLTRVTGAFNAVLHFRKTERMLRELAFKTIPQGNLPPLRHLMLAGPSGPASTLAETGEERRQQAIMRLDQPATANDYLTFIPGAVIRAFTRTGGDGLKVRSGFNVASLADIRAQIDARAEPKWTTVLALTGEVPLGVSRAWRDGAFVATCISQGANHGLYPLCPVTYRAYRADVRAGKVTCEAIPEIPPAEGVLQEAGVFLATTTCGSLTDRPLAACRLPDLAGSGSPQFSPVEELPDGLANMIRRLDGLEREYIVRPGF